MKRFTDRPQRHLGGMPPDEPIVTPEDVASPKDSDDAVTAPCKDDSPTTGDEPVDPVGCGPIFSGSLIVMIILQQVYRDMMQFLTSRRPEAGGMMLGPKAHSQLITHFIPDITAHTTSVTYKPDVGVLNKTLKQFIGCQIDCKGMAHSHPPGVTRPSSGDMIHVSDTFVRNKNSGVTHFYIPIVCGSQLYPYVVTRDEPSRVQIAQLMLL